MCLAVPAEIISISDDGRSALVSLDGVKRAVSLDLVDEVQMGDYVLIHVGFALQVISPEEARRTLELFSEAGLLTETS